MQAQKNADIFTNAYGFAGQLLVPWKKFALPAKHFRLPGVNMSMKRLLPLVFLLPLFLCAEEWPKVDIDVKKIESQFKFDKVTNSFTTEHFELACSKDLAEEEALRLAIRCETIYEAVQKMPFWPDKGKRKEGKPSDNKKLKVLISNETEKGNYNPQVDCATIHPRNIPKSGLEHEITHQLTVYIYVLFPQLTEGLAVYMEGITFPKDGKSEAGTAPPEALKNFKKIEFEGLKKFFLLPRKDFYAQGGLGYMKSYLVLNYFIEKDPKALHKFLDAIIQIRRPGKNPNDIHELIEKNFPLLLNGKTEKEVQQLMAEHCKKRGVDVAFKGN